MESEAGYKITHKFHSVNIYGFSVVRVSACLHRHRGSGRRRRFITSQLGTCQCKFVNKWPVSRMSSSVWGTLF